MFFILNFRKRIYLSKGIEAINELTVNQMKTKIKTKDGFCCNSFDRFGDHLSQLLFNYYLTII
jgi:hypothetical protein